MTRVESGRAHRQWNTLVFRNTNRCGFLHTHIPVLRRSRLIALIWSNVHSYVPSLFSDAISIFEVELIIRFFVMVHNSVTDSSKYSTNSCHVCVLFSVCSRNYFNDMDLSLWSLYEKFVCPFPMFKLFFKTMKMLCWKYSSINMTIMLLPILSAHVWFGLVRSVWIDTCLHSIKNTGLQAEHYNCMFSPCTLCHAEDLLEMRKRKSVSLGIYDSKLVRAIYWHQVSHCLALWNLKHLNPNNSFPTLAVSQSWGKINRVFLSQCKP
jgi:hypothetical protein